MKRELIFENTWKIEDDGVRIFILHGSEKTLVIDTGRSMIDLRSEPLNTHAAPDHIAGNQFFPTFYLQPSEAPVYYKLHNGTGSFPLYMTEM